MTLPVSPLDLDDRNLYPLHQDKDVPETSLHELIVRYLRDAFHGYAPQWFVTGNVCVYWERGNFSACCAPDVFVVTEAMPEARPRVYQLWRDPPIRFVAEIVSRATIEDEELIRLPKYQDFLHVPEHLYYDPETGELKLRRLRDGRYEEVPPDARGRVRSEQLGLEFGREGGEFLWVYTLDGERLLTHDEEVLRRQEAEARASEESRQRQAAEARAIEESRQRQAAEARAREADARASEEAARRENLERQLALLRAQLGQDDP